MGWLCSWLGLPVVSRQRVWVSLILELNIRNISSHAKSELATSIQLYFECSHCRSELNQPNKFEIYRTSQECCDEQFPGSTSCLQDSIDSHAPFPFPIHFPGMSNYRPFAPPKATNIWGTEASHRNRWFPDLINKQNCVWGNNYENWMQTDGFLGLYLFDNSTNCCKKWWVSIP